MGNKDYFVKEQKRLREMLKVAKTDEDKASIEEDLFESDQEAALDRFLSRLDQ